MDQHHQLSCRFHNLSGSRTPTDFSEIPSQLFERFLRNPEYVSKFFRFAKFDFVEADTGADAYFGSQAFQNKRAHA